MLSVVSGSVEATCTRPCGSVLKGSPLFRAPCQKPCASFSTVEPKCDVMVAMKPPPEVVRSPPVCGSASVPTRAGSWLVPFQLPRSVRVCALLRSQSTRARPE